MSTPKAPYAGDIFNTGQLLFDERPLAAEAEPITVPEVFYERGWTILNSVLAVLIRNACRYTIVLPIEYG
jgi:hypothetical protein